MVMRENEEKAVSLFHEIDTGQKENDGILLSKSSDDVVMNATFQGSSPECAPMLKITPSTGSAVAHHTAMDEFLNLENEKSDSDWLLTTPGTLPIPSLEKEAPKALMPQDGSSSICPTGLQSKLSNSLPEPTVMGDASSSSSMSSTLTSSEASSRKTFSSGGRSTASSKPATPTGRATSSTKATKPSRSSTPTARPALSSTKSSAPSLKSSAMRRSSTPTGRPSTLVPKTASRLATPTSRASITNSKSASRSSTPTFRPAIVASKSAPRSSTPTTRPSFPAIKSTSRSSTPTRRMSTSSTAPSVSAPAKTSVIKSGPAAKNPAPPRNPSSTIKSTTWKPSEGPNSRNASQNMRKIASERPVSAPKGRASTLFNESDSNKSERQQLFSDARTGRSSVPSLSRTRSSCGDDVNPVMMGTQMVERVVNMRRLMPPKQDTDLYSNSSRKSSDSSGFGRSLSKKSLDMALRHMDIQRSISATLRPVMPNIPAASMHSVRSGSTKDVQRSSKSVTISDSPLAPCSVMSSEPTMNDHCHYFEEVVHNNEHHESESELLGPISLNGR